MRSSLERSTLPHKKKGQLAFVKTTATLAASGWAELQQAVAAIIIPHLAIACPQVSTQSGDGPPREKVFDVSGLHVVLHFISHVRSVQPDRFGEVHGRSVGRVVSGPGAAGPPGLFGVEGGADFRKTLSAIPPH